MNIVLWILQILVGLMFVFHGYMLAFQYEQAKARPGMAYVGALPSGLRNFIAVCEVLGGLGLILPALTGILPWLTPLAAALLAVVMVLAAFYHLQRKEYQNIVFNLVLALVAGFVAYGRYFISPLI
jgi:uncharacterized membrane protein YphA (DoxX/SURF4 family)